MSLRKIYKLAKQIRKAFEIIEKSKNNNLEYYDLSGYCGRASIQLSLIVNKYYNIKLCLIESEGYTFKHVFNMYMGYIIDITVTQFKDYYPAVYIRKMESIIKLPSCHTPILFHKNEKSVEAIFSNSVNTIKDNNFILRFIQRI